MDLASTLCLLVGTLPRGNPRIPGTPCQIPPPGGSGVYKTPPYPSTAWVAHRQLRTNYNASSKSKNQRIQSRRRTQDEPWRLVAASTNFDTSTMQPHASMEHRGSLPPGFPTHKKIPPQASMGMAPRRSSGAPQRTHATRCTGVNARTLPRGARRTKRSHGRTRRTAHAWSHGARTVARRTHGRTQRSHGRTGARKWPKRAAPPPGSSPPRDPDAPWRRVVALWTCRNLLMRLQGATVHPESEGVLSSWFLELALELVLSSLCAPPWCLGREEGGGCRVHNQIRLNCDLSSYAILTILTYGIYTICSFACTIAYQELSGGILRYLELSGVTWSYRELSAAIYSYLELNEAV